MAQLLAVKGSGGTNHKKVAMMINVFEVFYNVL
jgi:hypothetical protein